MTSMKTLSSQVPAPPSFPNESSGTSAKAIPGLTQDMIDQISAAYSPFTSTAQSPAVHISATTGSHVAPPTTVRSLSHAANLQLVDSGAWPQKRVYLDQGKDDSRSRSSSVSLPPNIAGPGGGITLPTTTRPPRVPVPPSYVLTTTSPLGSGMWYSSASRATVQANDGIQVNVPTAATAHKANKSIVDPRLNRINSAPALSHSTNAKYKYRKVIGGKIPRSMSLTIETEMSPQVYLDKMLQARGYSTQNFCSLEGGYYCKPTPLQKASYGIKIVQAVRTSDAELLERMLQCGLSPNPCNSFGESLLHMVCRRGDYKLLKVLVDAGCSLQVTDDFGRTPLHDACWTAEPCFKSVELILNADERLLRIVDCRGSSPLSYIKRDHWKKWIQFFHSKVNVYWAPRDVTKDGDETPPPLVNKPPHSLPIPDPHPSLDVDTAAMISSGQMDPDDVRSSENVSVKLEETAPRSVATTC